MRKQQLSKSNWKSDGFPKGFTISSGFTNGKSRILVVLGQFLNEPSREVRDNFLIWVLFRFLQGHFLGLTNGKVGII